MVRRERLFRDDRDGTIAPRRVNDCQFALGFESANLRKRIARIPVLGVRGSSLGKAADLNDGGLRDTCSGPSIERKCAGIPR